MKVALQLYSLRDLAKEDFFGVIRETAEMGYEGVEFGGYFGKTAEELKSLLDELGLVPAGAHIGYERLCEALDEEIEYAKKLGLYSVVCPWAQADTKEGWEEIGRKLNGIGRKFRENGILFGYHNHAHEFEKYDGKYALDIIFENSDAENVSAEIDTYWVKKGGADVLEYTKKYADRMFLLHAKDLDENGKDMEVGTGCIDFKKITENLPKLEWIVIEQEKYNYPVLESVKIGCDNIMKLVK